jgi:hypothetical protein
LRELVSLSHILQDDPHSSNTLLEPPEEGYTLDFFVSLEPLPSCLEEVKKEEEEQREAVTYEELVGWMARVSKKMGLEFVSRVVCTEYVFSSNLSPSFFFPSPVLLVLLPPLSFPPLSLLFSLR